MVLTLIQSPYFLFQLIRIQWNFRDENKVGLSVGGSEGNIAGAAAHDFHDRYTSMTLRGRADAVDALSHHEDSRCDVDANFVFARDRGLVEVQGTGEKATFSKDEMITMLDLADAAAEELFSLQQEAVQTALRRGGLET